MKAVLQAQNLTIGHRGKALAQGLQMQLYPGQLVCLLGLNGAGKTTLLKTLSGLLPPLGGKVELMGRCLSAQSAPQRARNLALVLTERPRAPLFPVEELVGLGRQPHTGARGHLSDEDLAHIERAMDRAGVLELRQRHLGQLSDGQMQRVMIARALAQETPVMALDEPTAFLDLPHRLSTLRLLRRLAHEENKAVLLSTHELDLALQLADGLLLMGPEGLLFGAPEDLALSGSLEAVFGGEVLDPHAREAQNPKGLVRIEAEGDASYWAERAILRARWGVDAQAVSCLKAQGPAWELDGQRCADLGEVVLHLRSRA